MMSSQGAMSVSGNGGALQDNASAMICSDDGGLMLASRSDLDDRKMKSDGGLTAGDKQIGAVGCPSADEENSSQLCALVHANIVD
mmetsp:Transcript_9940/g.13529  ORF Transcript_9940/g.13529 Transcript_9940/m.13529 type:complete len:85 (+) Transcript_9940:582-836(+)